MCLSHLLENAREKRDSVPVHATKKRNTNLNEEGDVVEARCVPRLHSSQDNEGDDAEDGGGHLL